MNKINASPQAMLIVRLAAAQLVVSRKVSTMIFAFWLML